MDQAVILSTARTPIGKAYRGTFNDTDAPTLASFSIKASIEKAGLDPSEIEDVILGAAVQQGSRRGSARLPTRVRPCMHPVRSWPPAAHRTRWRCPRAFCRRSRGEPTCLDVGRSGWV
mgnify:CR=1 FL=1